VATLAWDESAVTSDDPEFGGKGARDTGEDFHAAPDIDHTNVVVQAGLKDFCKCASLERLCGPYVAQLLFSPNSS
jgi:hypothetical protein